MTISSELDCVLINPRQAGNIKYPPISLICLTAFARKCGFHVEICDAAAHLYSDKEIIAEVVRRKPAVVGYTFMTPQAQHVKFLSDGIRECLPDSLQIAGGTHPNALPEECLRTFPAIDLLVLGEGEQTFVEILERRRDSRGWNPREVDGLAFRQEGQVAFSDTRKCFDNLDSLPFPAWDDLPIDKYEVSLPGKRYAHTTGAGLTISSSRGCPFACQFCASHSVFPKGYRKRSAQLVVDELEYLYRKYHINSFFIVDEVIFQDKEHIQTLCREIRNRRLPIFWAGNSRVNSPALCDEVLEDAVRAGCVRVDFGVESGSPQILKDIRKGITLGQIYKAHRLVHRHGLATTTMMIVGHPNEGMRQVLDSVILCAYLESDYPEYGNATPFPATELYEIAQKKGWLRSLDWGEYRISNDPPVMRNGSFTHEELSCLGVSLNLVMRIFAALSACKRYQNNRMKWTLYRFLVLYRLISERHKVCAYDFDVDQRSNIVKMFLAKDAAPQLFLDTLKSFDLFNIKSKPLAVYNPSLWTHPVETLSVRGLKEDYEAWLICPDTSDALPAVIEGLLQLRNISKIRLIVDDRKLQSIYGRIGEVRHEVDVMPQRFDGLVRVMSRLKPGQERRQLLFLVWARDHHVRNLWNTMLFTKICPDGYVVGYRGEIAPVSFLLPLKRLSYKVAPRFYATVGRVLSFLGRQLAEVSGAVPRAWRLARQAGQWNSFQTSATEPAFPLPYEGEYVKGDPFGEHSMRVSTLREMMSRNGGSGVNFNKVVVFGTGQRAKDARFFMEEHGSHVEFWCDNDARKHGTVIDGIKVLRPSQLRRCVEEPVVIASQWYNEIAKQLNCMGVTHFYIY